MNADQYPYTRFFQDDTGSLEDRGGLGPRVILSIRPIPELEELLALRTKGWDAEHLDTHFKDLRQTSDNADERLERLWYNKMQDIAQELDEAASFVPRTHRFKFLDVGCAPGGFSFYVLRKNSWACGTGITLPESAGGHAFLLDRRYRRKYKLIEQDILQYNLTPNAPHTSPQRLPDNLLKRFPLVMLDGHALRTYRHGINMTPDELKAAHGVYRDRLLVSQLIIALEAVSPGGTILIRLSHIECFPAAQLIYMLDALADSIVVHKPRVMHAMRGTFYVIAKGVNGESARAALRERYLDRLKKLWRELGEGREGRMMVPGDLDFIATADTILEEYLDRLIELGREVWLTQIRGLSQLFTKKGIL
ncbi:hypothetical protein C8Q74DRAFT_1215152 [Fomes fomentarius]|nr:hypothetical protein C8Q74DRAFT_1215152 [Fomes fomentarius]